MQIDKLIPGNPYIYNGVGDAKQTKSVLYKCSLRLNNGTIAYHFRFRRYDGAGFVNLTKEQVLTQISSTDEHNQ